MRNKCLGAGAGNRTYQYGQARPKRGKIGSEVVAGAYWGGYDRFRGGCRCLLRWL